MRILAVSGNIDKYIWISHYFLSVSLSENHNIFLFEIDDDDLPIISVKTYV